MRRSAAITGLVLLVWASGLSAQTLTIAASANAEGANQTRWRTDLQVKALGGASASFTVELLETGVDNSEPQQRVFTVEPNESRRFGNVLDAEFGFTGTAALRLVVTEGSVAVASRTYNTAADGTYGQSVPAIDDVGAVAFGTDVTLIQLSRSPDPSTGYRSNIGFVSLVDRQIRIEIELFAADGTLLGTLQRALKAFEHRQLNDVFHLVGADDVADGYAILRTTTDDGRFLPYASVVDNGSGDAVFLLAQEEVPEIPAAQERLVVLEAFTRPG
jgi:hypothetical protein